MFFSLFTSSHFFTVYLPVTSESRERSLAEDLLQVVFHMRGESVLHPPPRSSGALPVRDASVRNLIHPEEYRPGA
jgi:hypothetical protein